MTRRIVDPRFAATMGDYYPSLCTIQEDVGVQDANGAVVSNWQNLSGHVDVPCALGPSKGDEIKQQDETYAVSNFTLSLRGWYPLADETMRAVVDGVVYDIALAQSSSHDVMTRLLVRRVS